MVQRAKLKLDATYQNFFHKHIVYQYKGNSHGWYEFIVISHTKPEMMGVKKHFKRPSLRLLQPIEHKLCNASYLHALKK